MSCPQGFSCAQSSITGIFMCCRLASNIQCPKKYTTMLVNNNPRLCSINRQAPAQTEYQRQQQVFTNNGCPLGFACLQSNVVLFNIPVIFCNVINKKLYLKQIIKK